MQDYTTRVTDIFEKLEDGTPAVKYPEGAIGFVLLLALCVDDDVLSPIFNQTGGSWRSSKVIEALDNLYQDKVPPPSNTGFLAKGEKGKKA